MIYYTIYKPYGMLSQFTREVPQHRVLGDLYPFEKDVYPVGRLDRDSEGLLILTNDKRLNDRLLNPRHGHERTYWAQIEGAPTDEALQPIRDGLPIKHKGKIHHSAPATVRLLSTAPPLPERDPPVRFRKSIPTVWAEITLTEGKNRQVRKLFAAVGFPVLRLVRQRIGRLEVELEIGSVREWEWKEMERLLF